MPSINPTLPTIGQPNSTEDQDVINALTTIIAAINGGLDTANLTAAAGVTAAQLATAVQAAVGLNGASTRRGKSIVATEESTASGSYTTLATPDRVSGIVLPTDGLIFVAYQATWRSTVSGAAGGAASIFLGATQTVAARTTAATADVVAAEAITAGTANNWHPLASHPTGLVSVEATGGTSYTGGDLTTGQVVGLGTAANPRPGLGGICAIFAAAGTYDVSVRYKNSSGTTTVKNRRLWCWSQGFD